MDLISGQPLWPVAAGLPACYPALRSDLECEVAVLGAGITGALVAHRFAADGIDVVVVDRSEVGHGSTAASTALVLYELDTQLAELEERIEELARAAPGPVPFERKRSLYLASRRPLIGRSDAFRRGYFALGYGGNGITFGAVATRLLLDLHRRRANPDLALFRLDRPAR